MKVNFACGKQTWDGWYCIDAVQSADATRPVDLLHRFSFERDRLINPLPLEADSVDELHSYHFIEHLYAWEAPAVVREFRRIIRPGGRLVLELPNLEKACSNFLQGKKAQDGLWRLYGDPGFMEPLMCHKWGYTKASLMALLRDNGFPSVLFAKPKTHGCKLSRDMRAEAS